MGKELLLVGSVPFDTTEEALMNFGAPLSQYLQAIPDGETGDRRWWVQRLSYQVFNGHPHLRTIRRPPLNDGVEVLLPRSRGEFWQFEVAPGVEEVRFGDRGWRLGFAREAINSYFVFRTLREKGILPEGLRFQVSLPLVNSVIRPVSFPKTGDVDRLTNGYQDALLGEIETIVKKIPTRDLAFQWDLATEVIDIYAQTSPATRQEAIKRHTSQVANISAQVPAEVALGIHFCFGTYGGWPRFSPEDLGPAVDYANACSVSAGRAVNWIHIPATDTTEESFYEPLTRLESRGARVYLGIIHHMETFGERFAIARRFLPDFGVAAYCGLGRNAVDTLPQALTDHLKAVRFLSH